MHMYVSISCILPLTPPNTHLSFCLHAYLINFKPTSLLTYVTYLCFSLHWIQHFWVCIKLIRRKRHIYIGWRDNIHRCHSGNGSDFLSYVLGNWGCLPLCPSGTTFKHCECLGVSEVQHHERSFVFYLVYKKFNLSIVQYFPLCDQWYVFPQWHTGRKQYGLLLLDSGMRRRLHLAKYWQNTKYIAI